MNFLKPHRITAKITRSILVIEIIILAGSILLTFFFIHPKQLQTSLLSAQETNEELSSQIDTLLTNMTDSTVYFTSSNELQSALDDYQEDGTGSALARLRLTVSNLTDSMSYVTGVQISGENMEVRTINEFSEEDEEFFDYSIYAEVAATPNMSAYSAVYQVSDSPEVFHMAYCLNRYIGADNYTFTIFYNVTSLIGSVETLAENQTDGCVLADYAGNIFYQTGDSEKILEDCGDSLAYFQSEEMEADSGYYFFSSVDSSGWSLVSYLTNKSINAGFRSLFLSLIFSYSLLCLATVILMTVIIRRTVAPIQELNRSMQEITAGDFKTHADIQTDDEIGELSNVYNLMVDSLNENIQKIIEHELTEEKMKYNLMASQIDSHFIYNTMSIINALARKGRDQEVIAVNSALLKILQNNLRVQTVNITDTVEQEVNVVKQYWIIENFRYENHAELIFGIEPSLYKEQIPKSILQPIVENCLLHGLIDEETGEIRGVIHVDMECSKTEFTICIRDNGRGIPPETLAFLNNPGNLNRQLSERGSHIGLSNIRERLEYIYKGKASMRIENRGGTAVTIILPKRLE